jgi:hypothetical protein
VRELRLQRFSIAVPLSDTSTSSPPKKNQNMSCSSTWTSLESGLSCDVQHISHDPSQTPRLGDLGYVDEKGRWRQVVNIADSRTCQKYRMKALQMTHDLEAYITEKPYIPHNEPFVRVSPGNDFQMLEPEKLAKFVHIAF